MYALALFSTCNFGRVYCECGIYSPWTRDYIYSHTNQQDIFSNKNFRCEKAVFQQSGSQHAVICLRSTRILDQHVIDKHLAHNTWDSFPKVYHQKIIFFFEELAS